MDKINYYLDQIESNLKIIFFKNKEKYRELDSELDKAYDSALDDRAFLNKLRFLNNLINKELDAL